MFNLRNGDEGDEAMTITGFVVLGDFFSRFRSSSKESIFVGVRKAKC
jgi:hypothetical protein